MRKLLRDVRLAARRLNRSQGFTFVTVLTLAMGIGANATIFSLVDATLLRRLPFRDPDQLVCLDERAPGGETHNVVAPANLIDWRAQSRSFQAVEAGVEYAANLYGTGRPREVRAALVTPGWFDLMGVHAGRGQVFHRSPDLTYKEVVVGHDFWRSQLAGDPQVIGRTLRIDGDLYTITGVLPAAFEMPGSRAELWRPFHEIPGDRTHYGRFLFGYGRLRPGVTLAAAQADLDAIAKRLAHDFPDYDGDWGVTVTPLREAIYGSVRAPLLILLGAVAILLLIVCANVASLLLGRAAGRSTEMALRLSLGATRGDLVRLLFVESALLALLGGAVGLLLASWGADLLVGRASRAGALLLPGGVHMTGTVVGFTAVVSIVAALLFGIFPAWAVASDGFAGVLRSGGRGLSGDRRRSRVRNGLIVAEVALALVLLAGAGLLGRTLLSLSRVDPGFRIDDAVAMRLSLSSERYKEDSKKVAFADELIGRLKAMPGVTAVGAVNSIPIEGPVSYTGFVIPGRPKPKPADEPAAEIRTVSGDYYRAMGIPLLRGRTFDARDRMGGPRAFVIDEELARQYYKGEDPVGKKLIVPWGEDLEGTVIGIVGAVHQRGIQKPLYPTIYWWNAQMPNADLDVVVRAASPAAVARAFATQVHRIDPEQPISKIRPLTQIISDDTARARLLLVLVAFFALAALLLAGIGLYGVISYSVSQRTGEIGVRMACGAGPRRIVRMIVRQGMVLTAVGLGVGLVVAAFAGRLASSVLYGVHAWDPATLGGALLFLAAVALLASALPARRAARIEPMSALRQE